MCKNIYKDMLYNIETTANILYDYKWSITLKNCESLYYTPVTYIILYINYTSRELAQQKRIGLGTMRFQVQFLALISGLRIQHCLELWCRSQTQLGSGIAVAVV